jgi:hypothetical protein
MQSEITRGFFCQTVKRKVTKYPRAIVSAWDNFTPGGQLHPWEANFTPGGATSPLGREFESGQGIGPKLGTTTAVEQSARGQFFETVYRAYRKSSCLANVGLSSVGA